MIMLWIGPSDYSGVVLWGTSPSFASPSFKQGEDMGVDLPCQLFFWPAAIEVDDAAPLEAPEYPADPGQIAPSLKQKIPAPAVPDPLQAPAGLDVKDEDQVRFDRKGLVLAPDALRVDPFGPLVSDRRVIIPVEDDHLLFGQGRLDVDPDVLPPILDEKVQFLLRRQASGRLGHPFYRPPPSSPRRLSEQHSPIPQRPELPQQTPRLGGLAGAIDPFEDDEKALSELHQTG